MKQRKGLMTHRQSELKKITSLNIYLNAVFVSHVKKSIYQFWITRIYLTTYSVISRISKVLWVWCFFSELSVVWTVIIGPRREKTGLRDFRRSEFQTSLLSYRDYLENWNITCSKFIYDTLKKRITKALIRLRGCAAWSAPVLFANPRRFSGAEARMEVDIKVYNSQMIIIRVFKCQT